MSTKKKPKPSTPKTPLKATVKATVKAKTTKKTPKGKASGKGTMGFSVTAGERKIIKAQAERLAEGNLSAFIRHAALTCRTRVKG